MNVEYVSEEMSIWRFRAVVLTGAATALPMAKLMEGERG